MSTHREVTVSACQRCTQRRGFAVPCHRAHDAGWVCKFCVTDVAADDLFSPRPDTSPEEWRVEGGFPSARGKVPVLPPRPDKYQPKLDDSKAVADWRKRMATDEAKEIYKQRAATAVSI